MRAQYESRIFKGEPTGRVEFLKYRKHKVTFQIQKYEHGKDILNVGGGFTVVVILHHCIATLLLCRLRILFSNLKIHVYCSNVLKYGFTWGAWVA